MKLDDILAEKYDVSMLSDMDIDILIGFYNILYSYPYDEHATEYRKRIDKLFTEKKKRHELVCSVCGKSAAFGTPYIDEKLNVYCQNCSHDVKDILLHGIDQKSHKGGPFKTNGGKIEYRMNGVVLHCDAESRGIKGRVSIYSPKFNYHCWVDNGSTCYPIENNEIRYINEHGVTEFLKMVANNEKNGIYKCTDCSKAISKDEVAGRPLFAGRVCKECWNKHLKKLNDEKKSGHVCSRCGEPYSNCCC